MALFDMCAMNVAAAPGTGPITLGSALVSAGTTYLTLTQAGAVDGDSTSYRIRDTGVWEIGQGVVGGGGTTLTRGLIKSSTGSLVNASAAATIHFVSLAEDFQLDTIAPNLTATGTDQASALVLTKQFNEVLTVAAGTGTRLPAFMSIPGRKCRIAAYGGDQLLAYPLTGQAFFFGGVSNGANQPLLLNSGTVVEFEAATATKVYLVSSS